MVGATKWRDVKAKAGAADPTWDSAERMTRRRRMREQMLASVSESGTSEIGGRNRPASQLRS
jgi:hypothetical protein